MITPNDLSCFDEQTINDIFAKIDAEIAENHTWYSLCDFAILTKEYPKQLRDKIAQMYRDSDRDSDPEEVLLHTRMHLSKEQATILGLKLLHFGTSGDISERSIEEWL